MSVYKVINGYKFSTQNHDNDGAYGNCALVTKGGWWFNCCCEGTLTGAWNVTLRWNKYRNIKYVDFMIKVK